MFPTNQAAHMKFSYSRFQPAPSFWFRATAACSRAGGAGKELFYIASDGMLMAVGAKTAKTFEAGIPHALFGPQIQGRGRGPVRVPL